AYFGTSSLTSCPAPAAQILKLRLSDFTVVDTLTLANGEESITTALLDSAAGFAYFGSPPGPCAQAAGRVIKVRLADFTPLGELILSGLEQSLSSAVIDRVGGLAYFGTGTGP